MRLSRRYATAGVFAVIVVSSCGATPEPVGEPLEGVPTETLTKTPLSTTSTTTATTTTTTKIATETKAIVLPDLGVRVEALPADFEPLRESGVIEVSEDIEHWYQVFATPQQGATVTVSVTRGDLPKESADTLTVFRPGAVLTESKIRDRSVYRLAPNRELTDEEAIFLNITEFFWYHDDRTVVAVSGQGFDDEDVLLAIARSIEVSR